MAEMGVRTSDPRIAVVIPCWNDGATLPETLASIREDEAIEVVVVDDGSTDPATLACLAGVAAEGVRVVRQDNAGPAAAVQRGIDETSAPFVVRLDADDLLEHGVLSAMADALEADPSAGFAYGDFAFFGAASGVWRPPPFNPWMAMYGNFWSPTCLFRRSALADAGRLQPGWKSEDWRILIMLADRGYAGVHCGRLVYRRRLVRGRMQSDYTRNHRSIYRQMQRDHAAYFARRREFARTHRPALWRRALYPLFLGPRYAMPEPVYRVAVRGKLWLGARSSGGAE